MGHEVAHTRYPFHSFLSVADWHLSEVKPLKVRALFMAALSRADRLRERQILLVRIKVQRKQTTHHHVVILFTFYIHLPRFNPHITR